MTYVDLLTKYLSINLLLIVAFVFLAGVSFLAHLFGAKFSSRQELKMHYLALCLVIALGSIELRLPGPDLFAPVARVWMASTSRNFDDRYLDEVKQTGYIGLAQLKHIEMQSLNPLAGFSLLALILIFVLVARRFFLDIRALLRIRRDSVKLRTLRGVNVYVSSKVLIPFSYWLPGQTNVVLPESLIGDQKFKISLLHELQHHRQGDTHWVYLLLVIRFLFFINPFAYIWGRWIAEIQEFACDEALIRGQKVSSHAYAACVLQVAQNAAQQERLPNCAMGLAFLVNGKTLKRRIIAMLNEQLSEKKKVMGRSASIFAGLGLLVALTATAVAAQGLVQDRRVTMSQAKEMAETAQRDTEFPIVVNGHVLKWLNFFLATPEGREQTKRALQRMENHRPVVEEKIASYRVPYELIAIPIVESGYRNLEPGQNPYTRAAGLWQFIASTARAYGLRVDDQVDERLNIELETDAAMRLLLANKLRFKDWHLSLIAYNSGERFLGQSMQKFNTRNAWKLIENFPSNEHQNYLPKVMAAMIILKNPSSLD